MAVASCAALQWDIYMPVHALTDVLPSGHHARVLFWSSALRYIIIWANPASYPSL